MESWSSRSATTGPASTRRRSGRATGSSTCATGSEPLAVRSPSIARRVGVQRCAVRCPPRSRPSRPVTHEPDRDHVGPHGRGRKRRVSCPRGTDGRPAGTARPDGRRGGRLARRSGVAGPDPGLQPAGGRRGPLGPGPDGRGRLRDRAGDAQRVDRRRRARAAPAEAPGALVGVVGDSSYLLWFVLLALIMHLTPDGRPLSQLWAVLMWLTVVSAVVGIGVAPLTG